MSDRKKRDAGSWFYLLVVIFALGGLVLSYAKRAGVEVDELADLELELGDLWGPDNPTGAELDAVPFGPDTALMVCRRDLRLTARGSAMLALEVKRLRLELDRQALECSI